LSEAAKDLEGVADLALEEITRRFTEAPRDIPDHVLAKYFTDINKTIDRRTDIEEEEVRPFDLKDTIDTFPVTRQKELAREEIHRLQAELRWWGEWFESKEEIGHEQEKVEAEAEAADSVAGP